MATRANRKQAGRTKGDVTIVEMVNGFVEDADARRHVRKNLNAFCRVAQRGGRACRIARESLTAYYIKG